MFDLSFGGQALLFDFAVGQLVPFPLFLVVLGLVTLGLSCLVLLLLCRLLIEMLDKVSSPS